MLFSVPSMERGEYIRVLLLFKMKPLKTQNKIKLTVGVIHGKKEYEWWLLKNIIDVKRYSIIDAKERKMWARCRKVRYAKEVYWTELVDNCLLLKMA